MFKKQSKKINKCRVMLSERRINQKTKNRVYMPLLVYWVDNFSFRDIDGNLYKKVREEVKQE